MKKDTSRREFIRNSTFAASALAFTGISSTTFAAEKTVKAKPLFKISLAQWSLNQPFFKRR